jgi:hypothetical protein
MDEHFAYNWRPPRNGFKENPDADRPKYPGGPVLEDERPGEPPGEPPPPPSFPEAIPASLLKRGDPDLNWLWRGYLNRKGITLLSALWKAGKTTLLAHLLKALETGGSFCGLATMPSQVLYITEEHEGLWAERRDLVGIRDHVHFLIRPFRTKPDWSQWQGFLDHLNTVQEQRKADLIVFDTISNLWPVKDENDASQVQATLMPLRHIAEGAALSIMHHLRKCDGREATGSRGSGALAAFCDILIELRRYAPDDRKDTRRVLTGYSRWRETADELVIQLTDNNYQAHGDRQEAVSSDLRRMLYGILPRDLPGMTVDEVLDNWQEDTKPPRRNVLRTLQDGVGKGCWARDGAGKKGNPFTFFRPPS